jgi:hypothetical protein
VANDGGEPRLTSSPGQPGRPTEALLAGLWGLLEGDPDVAALGVFGSGAGAERAAGKDAWSDLDAAVVVRDGTLNRFFPGLAWLGPLGGVFASEQSGGPRSCTTRVCFADFARLDLVLTNEGALERVAEWPRVPFWDGCRVIFSRSEAAARALRRRYPPPGPGDLDPGAFATLAGAFWFKAVQAVLKVVRGDRLIALHLSLDLLRDCCLLEMLLRDRDTGTSVHRDGGRGNAFVDGLRGSPPGYEPGAILDLVEECAALFDRLGGAWSPGYEPRRAALAPWIAQARAATSPTS